MSLVAFKIKHTEICKIETVKTFQHIPNILRIKTCSTVSEGMLAWRPKSIPRNVIAVFAGCRTMTFPAAPCVIKVKSFVIRVCAHTHPHTHTHTITHTQRHTYIL